MLHRYQIAPKGRVDRASLLQRNKREEANGGVEDLHSFEVAIQQREGYNYDGHTQGNR